MKKIITIVGTICFLLILAFSIGAAPVDPKDISAEISALRKEVLSLQERVKALEKRLDSAAIFVPGSQPWRGGFRLLDALRQYTPVPKGWQKRQFNGITYYVIPIDHNFVCPSNND
ncbi:MAG: hypothetical protein ACETVZ_01010 [Phycisphaerae bacterium]